MADTKRKHPRKRLRALVLKPQGYYPQSWPSQDLSLGGIFVAGREGSVGDDTSIMLVIETRLYLSKARIVRAGSDGVALEFVEPSDEFLEAVRRILESTSDPEDAA